MGARMFEVSHKELDGILVQIDQAIDNHEQWHRQLMRTLVCRLQPDQRDLDGNAHTQCRFGQWYYEQANPALHKHPTFTSLEREHTELHALVANMLSVSVTEASIDPMLYDQFANTLERMRLQLFSLKHEIEAELHNRDPLTGAYTRYGMLATLRDQQALTVRGVGHCAVAMIDVDHFKRVNDEHGHAIGDHALTHLSSILLAHLRPYDKLYRYGGEEFVLVLPNTPEEMAVAIAERMRKLVEDAPISTEEQPVGITISVGVAMLDPDVPVEMSIERADQAMYVAKQQGRNQVRTWESAPAEV